MHSISKIASTLVLVLYLSPLIPSLNGIGFYISNFDYIKTNLCVNKEKPEVHCEGTCVLARMIGEQSNEGSLLNSYFSEISFLIGFENQSLTEFLPVSEVEIRRDGLNPNHYRLLLANNTLDPPEPMI